MFMISASLVKELREKSGAGMLNCKKALEHTNGDIEKAMDYLREKGIATAAKKSERIAAEGTSVILIKDNDAVIVEVNSETDFVAKNIEFKELVDTIANSIIDNNPKTIEDVLNLTSDGTSINDILIAKTSKIGEKLSFRRFEKVTKTDDQIFGSYIHLGGKIAVLTLIEGGNDEVAKDIAMHTAAMRPIYVSKEDVPKEEVERERAVLKEQAINEGKPAEIAEKMVEGRIRKYYEEICLTEQAFVKDGDLKVSAFLKNNDSKIIKMVRYEVGEGIQKREDNFAEEVAKQIEGK
ncbi:MAG: translation elongation factor Ts [Bacilli bacterium]|nr:translation elongation factor Ts [Bacilli bacterium]